MKTSGRIAVAVFLGLLAPALLPSLGQATRVRPRFPRVALFTSAIGTFDHEEKETIAKYDLVVCRDRPESVDSIRTFASDHQHEIELLWTWMP